MTSTDAISTKLSAVEKCLLTEHEGLIERGLSTFYEVGSSLLGIRDGRLYRATHKLFEDYCRERWKMTSRHLNRLISAAEITSDLGPIGPKQLPTTESQARPLAKLPREQRAEVWEQAVETAPVVNGEPKVTAKHVEKVVAASGLAKPKKKQKPAVRFDETAFLPLCEQLEVWLTKRFDKAGGAEARDECVKLIGQLKGRIERWQKHKPM